MLKCSGYSVEKSKTPPTDSLSPLWPPKNFPIRAKNVISHCYFSEIDGLTAQLLKGFPRAPACSSNTSEKEGSCLLVAALSAVLEAFVWSSAARLSNINCCSQRTKTQSIQSVPGHSPLKFKQIFKIKDLLVLETCIILGRHEHASCLLFSGGLLLVQLKETFLNRKSTWLNLCYVCCFSLWSFSSLERYELLL